MKIQALKQILELRQYKLVGTWMLFSLALGVNMVNAGPWLSPKTNFEIGLDSFEQFSKYQQASAAIWKYSNRRVLLRRISRIPEYATSEIEIRSIFGNEKDGYQREVVVLDWTEDQGWFLKQKNLTNIKPEVATKAYQLIRRNMIMIQAGEEIAVAGLDSPPKIWECLHDPAKGIVLQGVQFAIPVGENELNDYKFLRSVLFDENN